MSDVSGDWRLRTLSLSLERPLIMGILNVTPDSFSDGGQHAGQEAAVAHGLAMVDAGADLVDVGGESTRPGAEAVPAEMEKARTIPVVAELAARGVVVSIDTSKPDVAEAAVAAGAEVVNDVTAARAPRMPELLADTGVGVVLMHMRGTPRTMQDRPHYDDVVGEVGSFLARRARVCEAAGVLPERIVVDPGLGFGKNLGHNLDLLAGTPRLAALGYPVMVGPSRKSFLGAVTGIEEAAERDDVTAVSTALAVERGVAVVRVHDVARSRHAAAVAAAIVARISETTQR